MNRFIETQEYAWWYHKMSLSVVSKLDSPLRTNWISIYIRFSVIQPVFSKEKTKSFFGNDLFQGWNMNSLGFKEFFYFNIFLVTKTII